MSTLPTMAKTCRYTRPPSRTSEGVVARRWAKRHTAYGFGRMGVFWPAASHHFPSRRTSTYIAISEKTVASSIGIGWPSAPNATRRTWAIATSGVGANTITAAISMRAVVGPDAQHRIRITVVDADLPLGHVGIERVSHVSSLRANYDKGISAPALIGSPCTSSASGEVPGGTSKAIATLARSPGFSSARPPLT